MFPRRTGILPRMELLDLLMILAYAGAVLAIGAVVTRRHGDADDFLLGGRRVPTGAVLLSLVATELSAATFVGVPSSAFGALAWTYLQFGIGSLVARLVLARTVIPLYHRAGVRTVYEFVGGRFGDGARRATAATFLVGRIFASSVRLYIAAFAFALVIEVPIAWAIVGCGLVAAAYSVGGGIRAVIWTDALQGAVLLLGAAAALLTIGARIDGGLPAAFSWASEMGAMGWIDISGPAAEEGTGASAWLLSILGRSDFLVTALLGGFFLTLATHSTDHDMVQRLLTTKTGRQGGSALAWSGFVNFPVVILFLSIGTALAAYQALGDFTPPDAKGAFPHFVRTEMLAPWRGLVLAGLFAAAMSSLDSAICAIGATWSVDLAGRHEEAELGRRSRWSTLFFAVVLILGAISFAAYERVYSNPRISLVEVALSAMTIVYGALLGTFLCGFLTRRGNSRGVAVSLAVGGTIGAVLFLQKLLFGAVPIAWPWWIPISATVSFAVTCAFPAREEGADADTR